MNIRRRKSNERTASVKVNWLCLLVLTGALCLAEIAAQTNEFTYQGKLSDGGTAANGSYDMRFRLFDAPADGSQVGATLTVTNVLATAGVFSVGLDFGAAAFSGADRFLEIAISPAGQNNFTTLAPRRKLTSAPYSIQSANAQNANIAANSLNLGGVAANQFVQTGDARLTDARVPLPGSDDYIQNTNSPQAGVNFSIGGTGSANIFNAAAQFNLNGIRFLSAAGTNNIFAGFSAGQNNTTGAGNSFFGFESGKTNSGGNFNAFFGAFSGSSNTSGTSNAFFGNTAGFLNSTGGNNSFFGQGAGRSNTTGSNNVFIGLNAGNPTSATQVSNSVAIGSGAVVEQSNTIVLGTTAQTTIARGKLVAGFGSGIGAPFTPGAGWIETWSIPNGPDGIFAGNLVLRSMLSNPTSNAGPICYSNFSFGATGGVILNRCSSPFSSINDKTDIEPFTGGIEVIKQLRPVVFKRKTDGAAEIGLNVEEVQPIAPVVVARGLGGESERVSESGLSVLFINAFKQQQAQIEAQGKQIAEQQKRIEALVKLACAGNPQAEICRE